MQCLRIVCLVRFCLCAVLSTYVRMYSMYRHHKDAMATIYLSATAIRCLFEGSAYSRVMFNSVTGTHV